MRSCDADTSLTYQSKAAIDNNEKEMNEKKCNNKRYEANDEIALNMCSLEQLTGRRDKSRGKIDKKWYRLKVLHYQKPNKEPINNVSKYISMITFK